MHRGFVLTSVLFTSLTLAGCDDNPTGSGGDAGLVPDSGPPLTCATTTVVEPVVGEPTSVTFDTAMTEERPRDLGLSCGNTSAELRWAPQEVVELHVPGTGLMAVELDTIPGTPETFNTVLQVRRTCEQAPSGIFPPTCFDDVDRIEFRAAGAFAAMGGEVVYVIVTGFSAPPAAQGTVDRGVVRLDIRVRPDGAPTLTSGFFRLANQDVLIGATGQDPDGDAVGVAMNFLGAAGQLLDIYGDGEATMDGDVFVAFFEEPPSGTAYEGLARVLGRDVTLAAFVRGAGVRRVILRAFDAAFATSAELEVPVEEAILVGLGEMCDDEHACRTPMTCRSGECVVTGAAAAVCTNATVVPIEAPTTTATTATVNGSTGAGYGHYEQTCALGTGSQGAERAYSVAVPAGTFDLIATTDLPGTGTADTILALRAVCPDEGTEIACNDDAGPSNLRSTVEARDLEGGTTYFLMVESFGGVGSGSVPHALQVTLRPVLDAGATCDPAEEQNRCATGACSAEGVCPD